MLGPRFDSSYSRPLHWIKMADITKCMPMTDHFEGIDKLVKEAPHTEGAPNFRRVSHNSKLEPYEFEILSRSNAQKCYSLFTCVQLLYFTNSGPIFHWFLSPNRWNIVLYFIDLVNQRNIGLYFIDLKLYFSVSGLRKFSCQF